MTTLYSNTTFQANTNILYGDNATIIIDYRGYFERIATAAENCAANLASIAANVASIEQLGSVSGFKTITPDGVLGLATTYRYLVINGMSANTGDTANTEIQDLAKQNITSDASAAISFLSTLPPLTF